MADHGTALEAGSASGGAPPRPDAAAYRTVMGRLPTGVALLTAGSDAALEAMTLNSLTSVSLDPLLLLVAVRVDSRLRPAVDAHGSFAVSVLTEDQRDVATEFARRDRARGRAAMRRLGAITGVAGDAVLPAADASLECVLHARHTAGDHVLFVGRVVALACGTGRAAPLLFHQGGFTRLPANRTEAA